MPYSAYVGQFYACLFRVSSKPTILGTLSYMDECDVDQFAHWLPSAAGQSGLRQSVLQLAPDDRAPAMARAHVRDCAVGLPVDIANDALLLTSELVTNAVEHGSPQIVLKVRSGASQIIVHVHDDGVGLPEPSRTSPSSSNPYGRGLRIVDAIATRWGIDFAEGGEPGKDVWFTLSVQPEV